MKKDRAIFSIYAVGCDPKPIPPPPARVQAGRFQYLSDTVGLPLEITSALKGYGPRGSVYRPEEGTSDWRHGKKRAWRCFRWFLLFSALLLVLGLVVYYLLIDVQGTAQLITTTEDDQLTLKKPARNHFNTEFDPPGSNESLSQDFIEIVEAPDLGTLTVTKPSMTYQEGDKSDFQDNVSFLAGHNASQTSDLVHNESQDIKIVNNQNRIVLVPRVRHEEDEEIMMTSDRDMSWKNHMTNAHSRQPVHPTLPSSISKETDILTDFFNPENETESSCFSPRLEMCKGVLPYDLTTLPLMPGIDRLEDLDAALPYFEMILQSKCSKRAQQFICSLLEPACQPMGDTILPPCRKACKAVAEECSDFMLVTLDLSKVFHCDEYPDLDDPAHCVNFAKGQVCMVDEFRCPEGTCIPKRWQCDTINDCQLAADEVNCSHCSSQEFKCEIDNRCIPLKWRCDGNNDCADSSDEAHCPTQEASGQPHTSPCPVGELRCLDGRCITMNQLCDGSYDCSDGADEANCGPK